MNQPIGENAGKLASQLGVIARNSVYCPITYTAWTCKELKPYKNRIWADIKQNCDVPDIYKKNCLKNIGALWRDWKCRLRKEHYYIYDNDEERLKNVPERVDAGQWKLFVKYMGTDMAKERSKTNRANQKKKAVAHKTGRKSHAVVRFEMTKDGVEPERMDVYIRTHTDENGVPVDQAATDAIAAMNKLLDEVPESERTKEYRDRVFHKVFGNDKHGRVRTYGAGPCPTEIYGKKNNDPHEQHVIETMRMEHEREIEKLRMDHAHNLEKARKEAEEKESNERKEYNGRLERLERMIPGLQNNNMSQTLPDQQLASDGESSRHHFGDSMDLMKVGMAVQLFGYRVPKVVVAEGVITSKDPNKEVDGIRLGNEFWEVRIDKPIKRNEYLLIARRNTTIADAKKTRVPWRTCDIQRK